MLNSVILLCEEIACYSREVVIKKRVQRYLTREEANDRWSPKVSLDSTLLAGIP